MEQRLQKIIASSGFCSRRSAEKLIEVGKVCVNGRIAVLGESADGATDAITIDGKPLPENRQRTYILLNKPRGYLSSMSDDRERRTVAELTVDVGARVYPVGRLDYDSEGLLLMTDDGEFAHMIMHPSHEVRKTYEARVRGSNILLALEILSAPMTIDGYELRKAELKLLWQGDGEALLSVTIGEGRNRQIRKMCEQAGLSVVRLRRVSEGSLKLGALPTGKWRHLELDEIENLQKCGEKTVPNAKTLK